MQIASIAICLIYLIWNKIVNNACQHTFSSNRHRDVHNWWAEIRLRSYNRTNRRKKNVYFIRFERKYSWWQCGFFKISLIMLNVNRNNLPAGDYHFPSYSPFFTLAHFCDHYVVSMSLLAFPLSISRPRSLQIFSHFLCRCFLFSPRTFSPLPLAPSCPLRRPPSGSSFPLLRTSILFWPSFYSFHVLRPSTHRHPHFCFWPSCFCFSPTLLRYCH